MGRSIQPPAKIDFFRAVTAYAEAVLRELGWPIDPHDPFFQETRRRSRTAKARRDFLRGVNAYSVLICVEGVQDAINRGDAQTAAYLALQAGLSAYDGTRNWQLAINITRPAREGGRLRGDTIRQTAARTRAAVRRLLREYHATLDPEPASPTAWIAHRLGVHPKTVTRHLHKLSSPSPRRTGHGAD